jgi:hypothetical protein
MKKFKYIDYLNPKDLYDMASIDLGESAKEFKELLSSRNIKLEDYIYMERYND